jgi:prevent-host-death family protein
VRAITSRELNQDVSQAKRLARIEPLFVTDRGRPTHVLMSIESYRRLTGEIENIVDMLAAPDVPDPVVKSDSAGFRNLSHSGR